MAAPGLFIADNMARSSPSGLEGVMIGCSHIPCPRTRTIITKAVVPISLAPFPSSPSQVHLRTTMLSPNVMGEIVTLFPMASHVAPLSWLVSLNAVMPTSRNNSMPQIIFHQNSLINITVVCVERETIGLGHVSMGCLSNAIHAMPMAINLHFVMRIMEMFYVHRGAARNHVHAHNDVSVNFSPHKDMDSCVFPSVNDENRDGLLPIDDHISRDPVDVSTVKNESCSFNMIIQNLIKHAMCIDGFENMIMKDTNRNSAFSGVLELLISQKHDIWKYCEIHKSPADGHCLLHSVVSSLKYQFLHNVDLDTNYLLGVISNEIAQYPERYVLYWKNNDANVFYKGFEMYAKYNHYNSVFGDHVPMILANALKIDLILIEESIDVYSLLRQLSQIVRIVSVLHCSCTNVLTIITLLYHFLLNPYDNTAMHMLMML